MKYFNHIVFFTFTASLLILGCWSAFFYQENSIELARAFDVRILATKKIQDHAGHSFEYCEAEQPSGKKAYIFRSSDLTEVNGYNGPLSLAVMTDTSGSPLDFKILKSADSPAYLQKAMKDKETYLQRNIFSSFEEKDLAAVTGATYSSKGISKALSASGNKFAELVLNKKINNANNLSSATGTEKKLLFFAFLSWAVTAFALRFRINRALRFASLGISFVLSGLFFHIQYSSESAVALLDFNMPLLFTIPFMLIIMIPLLALIFGNYYCGFLCPFGALQELINNLNFTGRNLAPDKKLWNKLRVIKYIVFLLLFALFIFSGKNHEVFDGDLLTEVFSLDFTNPWLAALIAGILFLSLFTVRFWCRNLCPAGAFLSIFNKVNILSMLFGRKNLMKYLPISPGYCDLGVSGFDDNDCINCDRCRINKARKDRMPDMEQEKKGTGLSSNVIYSVLTALFLILVLAASFYPFHRDKTPSLTAIPISKNYKDGIYQGKAKGYNGDVVCEIKISAGRISDIKIVSSSDDTPGESFTKIPSEIIKKQSTEVNAVTGATYSSNGVINAVKQALAKASGELKESPETAPKSANFTINPEDCKDGDYIGIGKGSNQITVSVTIKAGRIENIKVIDQQETMPGEAFTEIIPQIIKKQTLKDIVVPQYSQKTANGLIAAVNMALMVAAESRKLEKESTPIPHEKVIKTILLPPPDRQGGIPLMQALSNRKSTRTFSAKPLEPQVLSNLLWAAFGINRTDKGRTAPSDMNMQEIRIFLAMQDGLFVYDARANTLSQISTEDIRKHTGYQLFAGQAPLDLIYAADLNAMKIIKTEQEKETAAQVDTAFISQNVYLYCSSAGLNTVLLGWFDKKNLHKIMGLSDNFILTYTQPVGYPLEKNKE